MRYINNDVCVQCTRERYLKKQPWDVKKYKSHGLGKWINCEFCGKKFYRPASAIKEKNYCSLKCSKDIDRVKLKCSGCGQIIYKTKSYVREHSFKNYYCTKKCYLNNKKTIRTAKMVTVECSICGEKITKEAYRIKNNKTGRFFCYPKCAKEFRKKYAKGRPRTLPKKHCRVCGIKLPRYPNPYKNFCSRDCFQQHRCKTKGINRHDDIKFIEVNGRKYILSKLCKRKHEYKNTGKSLYLVAMGKYIGNCFECKREAKKRYSRHTVELTCFHCKKKFIRTKQNVYSSKSKNRFCSHACHGRLILKERNFKDWDESKEEKYIINKVNLWAECHAIAIKLNKLIRKKEKKLWLKRNQKQKEPLRV